MKRKYYYVLSVLAILTPILMDIANLLGNGAIGGG